MDDSQETDDYIRESIEHSLGLPVSRRTLELKLQGSEQALLSLRNQYLFLRSKLNEKDEIIERARAESCMSAIALKKFVEENQRLAMECSILLAQCNKLEGECSLYDHDRDALMEFGNEVDQRAKTAEIRIQELEEKVVNLSEELQFYKHQFVQKESQMKVDASTEDACTEQVLLESLLATIVGKAEDPSRALAFLESNSSLESCQSLIKMWNRLRPSTLNGLALVAEAVTLRKNKEHLVDNLLRAEEEVKVLFEENNVLEEENKRLRSLHHSLGSSGKISAQQGEKIKSSPKKSCLVESNDVGLSRQPLSPLMEN